MTTTTTMVSIIALFCLAFSMVTTTAVGWTWTKVTTTAPSPQGTTGASLSSPKVSGHVAVSTAPFLVSDNKVNINKPSTVFLFGGLTGPAGSPTTNDLYEYHNDDGGGWWRQHHHTIDDDDADANKKDSWPRQRMYSAASILLSDDEDEVVDGGKSSSSSSSSMYLFGGWDPGAPGSGGEFLKDIWKLDMTTKLWTKLDVELPFPVSRHSACTVGSGKMVVIHTYQGILVFRRSNSSSTEATVTVQETTGEGPDGLSMCAQAPVGNDGLILFGGSTKKQELSDNVYYLDTLSWHWTKLKTILAIETARPCARASPCAAPVIASSRTNQVIIFGGASIGGDGYSGGKGLTPLNDAWLVTVNKEEGTAEWERICCDAAAAPVPEARLAATLTNVDGQRMVLQGGYDSTSKQNFDEPWILEYQ
jgi:Kelch motif